MDMQKYVHESNIIEGINDKEQDKQSMLAWKWLESQPKLTATVIKRVHKMITFTQKDMLMEEKGEYRTIQVRVGTHVPCKPSDVRPEMTKWLKEFMQLTPREAHVRFETIHPFRDGNGRTGRMIMWWHERKKGLTPTLLYGYKRHEYYAWFKGRGNPFEQVDLISALLALRDEDEIIKDAYEQK